LQYRAELGDFDGQSDQCGDRGGDVLQRIAAELCANAWRIWNWVGTFAGDVVSVRDGMDLQEATALGSFVWIAGNFRGGNDGVQQCGEITERVGDASGKLSFGRDSDGSKRGNVQRKSYAESPVALAAGEEGFGFRVAVFSIGREDCQTIILSL
jgi:hypothetical protein